VVLGQLVLSIFKLARHVSMGRYHESCGDYAMKNQLTRFTTLLLLATASVSPAWGITDVFVAVEDATNLGAGFEGPQLLHYTYDSVALEYNLNGNIALPSGSTINSLALGSSIGSSGGIYASIVGATNEVREYSWDRSAQTFSSLRSFGGTHSEIVLGADEKLYGFDSSTGHLNHYTASGNTFSVAGFQQLTDVGGTQQLAAHPTDGSIFSSGLNSDDTITEFAQWTNGLTSKVGYYPAGVLTAHDMTVSDKLSPITGQPLLWFSNDTSKSIYQSAWTFDTPLKANGDPTYSDFQSFTVFDSMDVQSDGTMISTGYFDFSVFGGTNGTHLWALEGGTDGIVSSSGGAATDRIKCESGGASNTGCFTTVGNPDDKFLLSIDHEDTIHMLGVGIIGGWKYDSTANNIAVVSAVHEIGTLGLPTAIATAEAPPIPIVEGDYNKNLVVDAADYTIWRDSLNSSVTPGSGADGTGPGGIPDGFIDSLDYNYWKARFGNTAGAGAISGQSVPEPSAVLLFVVGAIAMLASKRR
jgi:hypothetical protein